MICYKDKTFCGSNVEKHTCGREFTKEYHEDAVRWWGSEDYPLALGDFCDEGFTSEAKPE